MLATGIGQSRGLGRTYWELRRDLQRYIWRDIFSPNSPVIVIRLPLPRASALALTTMITLPLRHHTTANNSKRRRQCIVTHSGRSYPWRPRIQSLAVSDNTLGPQLAATGIGVRRGRRRGPRRPPRPPRTLPDPRTSGY